MHYYAAQRPELNYRPALRDAFGTPLCPIPPLTISCSLQPNLATIGCWLPLGAGMGKFFSTEVPVWELGDLFYSYQENPEEFLKLHFGYTGPLGRPVGPGTGLTLEDLGL